MHSLLVGADERNLRWELGRLTWHHTVKERRKAARQEGVWGQGKDVGEREHDPPREDFQELRWGYSVKEC